ncbi:hypothetical protein [Thermus thermamylovorans]|uniref:hypothetical protein n=1 Tax=Thermus thermamylovorans TaxID=2509362 RepID=UPI001F47614B|nr:hypothetical protein [Thermus thermamylovorans]
MASYQARIRAHQAKIEAELARPSPRWELIRYWEKEIAAYQGRAARLLRRMGKE